MQVVKRPPIEFHTCYTSPIILTWHSTSMKIKQHRLTAARFLPSPNYNLRPNNENITLLVIHNISLPPGQFGQGYIHHFFQNTLSVNAHPFFKTISDIRVSAHLLIERDGSITQFVPFDLRAWHAGVSSWKGKEHCNDFSIGIEMEGTDTMPYTSTQYAQLVKVTTALLSTYPTITTDNITGHEHIAPHRKTDPGPAFDWNYYHQKVEEAMLTNKTIVKDEKHD